MTYEEYEQKCREAWQQCEDENATRLAAFIEWEIEQRNISYSASESEYERIRAKIDRKWKAHQKHVSERIQAHYRQTEEYARQRHTPNQHQQEYESATPAVAASEWEVCLTKSKRLKASGQSKRDLTKIYHPDLGGSEMMMKAINHVFG